ncbi:LacI family DNA-binding transcriptional regulator [Enterobacter chuandaensis]|uniref:LacI family DNA-binding transcriptional regulator n=1 Tax=Enterobacter chuandaensis TaxID=2497875 RepID=UPI003AB5FEEE
MKGKLRIREIADATGFSSSTVSRVLSGQANVSVNARRVVLSYAGQRGILVDISNGRILSSKLLIIHKRPQKRMMNRLSYSIRSYAMHSSPTMFM